MKGRVEVTQIIVNPTTKEVRVQYEFVLKTDVFEGPVGRGETTLSGNDEDSPIGLAVESLRVAIASDIREGLFGETADSSDNPFADEELPFPDNEEPL